MTTTILEPLNVGRGYMRTCGKHHKSCSLSQNLVVHPNMWETPRAFALQA